MKAEFHPDPSVDEPYAVIHAREADQEVRRVMQLIAEEPGSGVIGITESGRIIVLRPEEIFMIRVEDEKCAVYTNERRFVSSRRLYEFERILGADFMRMSRSVLVSLARINYVQPSLGGMMEFVLKNGLRDYISRKYMPAFRRYLGL